jgi:hypothetical protein
MATRKGSPPVDRLIGLKTLLCSELHRVANRRTSPGDRGGGGALARAQRRGEGITLREQVGFPPPGGDRDR